MLFRSSLARLRSIVGKISYALGYRAKAFAAATGGNVAIATALTLPTLLGAAGLGLEVSHWYRTERYMQNAADSAAVAAATNGGPTYANEARAVAASYGFTNGANNTSIVVSNKAPCPAGGSNCFSVTITRSVPLILSQLVGYQGNVTVGITKDGHTTNSRQTSLTVTSVALRVPTPRQYCVLALGNDGAKFDDIVVNGGSKSNLDNCGIMSNNDLTCNGSNQIADYADSSSGDPSGCGREGDRGPVPRLGDPYSHLDANIHPNPCSAYPGEKWSTAPAIPPDGVYTVCGDLKLTGNVTIVSRPGGTVLTIYNGKLDTGSYKLVGTDLTIVFAGTNDPAYSHIVTGTNHGGIDIAAPKTGDWKGVAIHRTRDRDAEAIGSAGVDITSAGSGPTWDITGLVYLPHASVTFSGAVNKSSSGNACFSMVVDNLTVNGSGRILSNGDDCAAAGLDLPSYRRGRLVS
jgi:Flp pilus assembly protein TadG